MDKQTRTGYTLIALLLLLLWWLFKNGNPFLHSQVSATLGGAPIGPSDFYAGANAPCKGC